DYFVIVTHGSSRLEISNIPLRIQSVCDQAGTDASIARQARFYPVLEFNWSGWRWWVGKDPQNRDPTSIGENRTWEQAGQKFRRYMRQFLKANCVVSDSIYYEMPELWALQEVPQSWAGLPNGDPEADPDNVRKHVRYAIDGLFNGPARFDKV